MYTFTVSVALTGTCIVPFGPKPVIVYTTGAAFVGGVLDVEDFLGLGAGFLGVVDPFFGGRLSNVSSCPGA